MAPATETVRRPTPQRRCSFRLPHDLFEVLEDEAEHRGMSGAELVRSTLAAALFNVRTARGAR